MNDFFKVILFFFSFFCLKIHAEEGTKRYTFEVSSIGQDSSMSLYRIELFKSIFSKDFLNWDRDGFYLFIEENGINRLFYFNEEKKMKSVELYQYPKQRYSPWLDSEKYLEERDKIASRKDWSHTCYVEIPVEETLLKNMRDLHLERLPYLLLEDLDYVTRQEIQIRSDDALILGFIKDHEHYQYFYFRDVRWIKATWPSLFLAYVELFDLVDSSTFSLTIQGCQ